LSFFTSGCPAGNGPTSFDFALMSLIEIVIRTLRFAGMT
jgi:hypothetical protein